MCSCLGTMGGLFVVRSGLTIVVTPIHAQPLTLSLSPHPRGRLVRIASVVTAAVWHTEQGALAAAVDGSLHVWWNPRMAFLDRELMDKAKTVKEDAALGKAAGLVAFQVGGACMRRHVEWLTGWHALRTHLMHV